MATAATISLNPSTTGVLHAPTSSVTQDSCSRTSDLLQKNHDDYHMYFNTSGFHNHIAHHLLTIFALGASPAHIQKAFDENANYQRPQFPVSKDTVVSLSDPSSFMAHLGNERYFHDYEIFFRKEIEKASGDYGAVLNTHLFADTDKARDLLVRMFAGFYHPIIHLGFGVEFEQPAIIVEALAQAATHDKWPTEFVVTTTEKARSRADKGERCANLIDLIHEARANRKIRESPHSEDGNKVRDGVLKRALPEITDLCSQWHISSDKDDLRFRTAEMINCAAYFAGAAQHASRRRQIKFDFFYMHSINCSIFFSAFMDPRFDSWLKDEDRKRLLEFKGWSDIAMYVSRGSPELFVDEITGYKAKQPGDGWQELFERVDGMSDDGHVSKLVRALANGERVCAEYEGKKEAEGWMIKGDMWLKLAHMAVDSTEQPGPAGKWIRNTGFEEAWKEVPQRDGGSGAEVVKGDSSLKGVAESYHEK